MQVSLKVIGGKNDGREIRISVSKFIIGRGEGAHLRPASDLVSRNHCSISIEDKKVVILDMGSRNGTFVNGSQISEPHIAKVGDTLRVGRLQFEVVLDHSLPGNKKPKVKSIAEAAARTHKKSGSIEDSISDWLAADEPGNTLDSSNQFNLEETMALSQANALKKKERDTQAEQDSVVTSGEETINTAGKKSKDRKKKKPGKLPEIPKKAGHENSTNAADDVLRKFLKGR